MAKRWNRINIPTCPGRETALLNVTSITHACVVINECITRKVRLHYSSTLKTKKILTSYKKIVKNGSYKKQLQIFFKHLKKIRKTIKLESVHRQQNLCSRQPEDVESGSVVGIARYCGAVSYAATYRSKSRYCTMIAT